VTTYPPADRDADLTIPTPDDDPADGNLAGDVFAILAHTSRLWSREAQETARLEACRHEFSRLVLPALIVLLQERARCSSPALTGDVPGIAASVVRTPHRAGPAPSRPQLSPNRSALAWAASRPLIRTRGGTVMTTASRPSRPRTHTPDAWMRAGHRNAHPSDLAGVTRSVAAPEGPITITFNAHADSPTRSTSMSLTTRPCHDATPVYTTAAAHPPITVSTGALPLD
jgi:hypothetical protein